MTDIEYRVEYIIQRKRVEDDDFVEIGFGSSGGWGTVGQASYMADCAIQRGEWETEPGMPDPSEVVDV